MYIRIIQISLEWDERMRLHDDRSVWSPFGPFSSSSSIFLGCGVEPKPVYFLFGKTSIDSFLHLIIIIIFFFLQFSLVPHREKVLDISSREVEIRDSRWPRFPPFRYYRHFWQEQDRFTIYLELFWFWFNSFLDYLIILFFFSSRFFFIFSMNNIWDTHTSFIYC